jgi:hypothetical protein
MVLIDDDAVARSKGFVHYRGRPDWLTDITLERLKAEASDLRAHATQVDRQAHSPVGPQGRMLASSPEMLGLVADSIAAVRPSGNANYLYYDSLAAGIDPHIDSPDFPLQVLLMLWHEGFTEQRSSLVVFPEGPKRPVPVVLDPGELVLFSAASVYHGRTSVQPDECLTLMGTGYVPATI